MKRRKIIGLVLLIGTIVYLLASLLALYQNQRIKMEKDMKEAWKAYSDKEELSVKELSKDFNLLLEEKMDVDDMNQHILKYEGSFARMEKNVTNVTDEMAVVEYNINHLNERMELVENFYNTLYEKVTDMNTSYEKQLTEINNSITGITGDIEDIKTIISGIEKQIAENDTKYSEAMELMQEQLNICTERLKHLEENVLYYQYDQETQTLNVYGNRGEQQQNE